MKDPARSREFFNNLLMVTVILIVAPWAAYIWEASTGLTTASRRSLGQNSTAQHLASTRRKAIAVTVLGIPVVAWCLLNRREKN